MEENRGVYRVLVEKPEEKRPLGIPGHRWEDISPIRAAYTAHFIHLDWIT
jgi:hypothetical protein